MSRSLSTLLALLPRGRAWTRALGTRLVDLHEAIAAEFDRVEARVADFLREITPSSSSELLPEWEEITDATRCVQGASLEARREGVISRLVGEAPTEALTVETIEAMGYASPELTSWLPFQVGRSAAGDALTNDEWQHSLGIGVDTKTPEDDAALVCVVDDLQHLHVKIVWEFTAVGALLTEDGDVLLTEDGEELHAEA